MLLNDTLLTLGMKEFSAVNDELLSSEAYKEFHEEYPNYYLAHGFAQLHANYEANGSWQLGFYSPKKDDLSVFATEPIKHMAFEKAFKEGGLIGELKFTKEFISTEKVLQLVKDGMKEDYSDQIAMNVILILQVIGERPLYNITVVTQAFAMIVFRIDALSGTIILQQKKSVMDLKKEE